MKLKKEYIILIVIVVALVGYLIINGTRTGVVNYKLPKITTIKSDEIDKFEFAAADVKISLAFDTQKKIWHITPQNFPADTALVDSMLKEIKDLEIMELISDKKAYEKYNLDDANKISVVAMKGDKTLRSFDIGKVSDTTSHTYIKLTDNPNIYSVKPNLRTIFTKTMDELRDKIVMVVKKDSIQQISISYKGENIALNKTTLPKEKETDPEKSEWKIASTGKKADDAQVNDILDTLANLVCDSYIPENAQADFSKPYYTITLQGDKSYKLSALEAGADNMHPVITSESAYQSYLISWKMTRLMKTTEELTDKTVK